MGLRRTASPELRRAGGGGEGSDLRGVVVVFAFLLDGPGLVRSPCEVNRYVFLPLRLRFTFTSYLFTGPRTSSVRVCSVGVLR
jgi:hypothetical protein